MLPFLDLVLVEVNHAGHATVRANIDLADVAMRPDLAAPRRQRLRTHSWQRARLRAVFATEAFAPSAVLAGHAALVRLGKYRHRRRLRMIAQLSRAALEHNTVG